MSRTRERRLLAGMRSRVATAGALAILAEAGLAGAQGIVPGDPAPSAYTLPYGFEPSVQLRTYLFNARSSSGAPSEAWALGGWAGVRSPWFGDRFQFGIVGYTSQPLYAPADKPGSKLLLPDQDAINVLGEAFVAARFAGQTLTAYRQLLDRPFLNSYDSRMAPNTFEAYTLSGALDGFTYTGGYVTKIKIRDSDSYVWMSNTAGGKGSQQGLAFAGGTYAFAGTGYIKADEQFTIDVFNTFFVEARVPIVYDERTSFGLAAQYFPQRSVGAAQLGTFSTWGAGLQGTGNYGPFGAKVSWTRTGRGYDTLYPFGEHPSFLALMQVKFNTAGEDAWGVEASVDFASLGVPGITASAVYASGRNAIDAATGAPLPDQNETNVRVDYAFAKGSSLNGLVFTFRYSWLRQEGSPLAPELRAILNYAVPF